MFVSIITDCRDDNARTRQETRYAHLFPGMHVSFVGAATDSEAAGNLLDILDSADEAPGGVARKRVQRMDASGGHALLINDHNLANGYLSRVANWFHLT